MILLGMMLQFWSSFLVTIARGSFVSVRFPTVYSPAQPASRTTVSAMRFCSWEMRVIFREFPPAPIFEEETSDSRSPSAWS